LLDFFWDPLVFTLSSSAHIDIIIFEYAISRKFLLIINLHAMLNRQFKGWNIWWLSQPGSRRERRTK